jgi:hypothetical protein
MTTHKAQHHTVGELIVFEQLDSYYGKCCVVLNVVVGRFGQTYVVLTQFGEKKDIDDLTISFLMLK